MHIFRKVSLSQCVIASFVRGLAITCLILAACSDDSRDFLTRPSGGSSSSVKSSSSETELSKVVVGCKTEKKDNCEYGELLDERDGQTYKTVKMGNQWWMAENLNYALLQPTEDLDSSSFCQRDSLKYCEIFGRLYLKSAAMDSAGTWSDGGLKCGYYSDCSPKEPVRGVCPEGWHLPNDDEWEALFAVVGDSSLVPLALKSSTLWDKIEGGVDAFGFAVLPAGCRRGLGDYYSIGYSTGYWSATEDSRSSSKTIDFFRNEGYDYMTREYKNYAHPVRCVKD